MKQLTIIVLAVSCSAACSYGLRVENLALTSSARGVGTRIVTATTEFSGELLEVQETGLLILTSSSGVRAAQKQERQLRLVPFTAVREATFSQLDGGYVLSGGRVPDEDRRNRLRLVSRFPHGLAPDLLKKLLDSHGQTEVAGGHP